MNHCHNDIMTSKVHKLASKVHNSSTKVHNANYNDRPALPCDY